MKHVTHWLALFAVIALGGQMQAQVTFSNESSLLTSISGGGYSDCAVDMNGDQLDDVVRVTSSGIYVDYQQPDGTFTQEFYPMSVQNPPTWSICAADIDENGYTDLLFGNGSRVSFVYANDDGTAFTEDAFPEYIFSQRSTFNDINNDGEIDAFVCHDVDLSHPYVNNGGVLELDFDLIETLDVGGNYAAIWCDYDNDWDTDLYITKCRGGAAVGDPQRINLLYRNNGDGTFTSVGPEANMDDGDQSWTTCFEDFDNDGDFDAFTVNHAWANRMMENNGDGTFTDIIGTTGIDVNDLGAWNCDAGDFDNNGFVDIFSELDDELYLNNGDGTFTGQNLSFYSGGIGDFNNDGFLDVIDGNTLWINDGNDNNWLKVSCEGIISNKDGIGCRIEIYGEWGVQIREIRAGESFSPMSTIDEHFGLGTATAIDQLVVKWPSGIITTIDDPAINQTLVIPETGCTAAPNTITANGSTAICEGGSVELTAEAGDSYTWSNGEETSTITVTEPGNYSVVIWDEEGCASISNNVAVTLIQDETPMISIQGDDVFCEGGSAILTSTPGENYTWSNGEDEQTIVVNQSGEYTVMIDAICSDDQIESEAYTITVLAAADEPIVSDIELDAPGTATFTATGDNLMWYDAEDATDAVGTGTEFETPNVDVDNPLTYWVEASTIYGGEMEDGGKANNDGGGGLPSTGGVLIFDAYEPFTLTEVTIYVPEDANAGDRTIQLFDENGTLIQEHTEYFEIGTHQVELNFEVPVGTGLEIGCAENTLFRNSGGVSYPYAIGSVGSIYDSTFGGSYYYYFYDWQIQKEAVACPSDRVPVTASVVNILEGELLTSFNVYPNPATDVLTLDMVSNSNEKAVVRILDVAGKVIMNEQLQLQIGAQQQTLDVSALAGGLYNIEVSAPNGVSRTSVVVK